jgi:hypothetical protein
MGGSFASGFPQVTAVELSAIACRRVWGQQRSTLEEEMTGGNIADISWRLPQPSGLWFAVKLFVTICLIVTLSGCVSTREGDYDRPEFAADRRPI